MADTPAPPQVVRLAAERDERRVARDFAAADLLRDRIAALGYRVIDGPDGAGLEPLPVPEPGSEPRLCPADVASVLDEPESADASVHWIVEGWPEDVVRGIASFRAHESERSIQHVVVEVAGVGRGAERGAFKDVEFLGLEQGTGWATARNCGLRRSRGRLVLLVDGSIEASGDVFGPLETALADRSAGVVGPFGIVTHDLRTFEESKGDGPDRQVDAIEGYLMAFRRDVLRGTGMLDEKFKFYRTCDIEYSFRIKDAGLRASVVDVPVTRHEHRMWSSTSERDRERLSKRNYYRFLDRFRGRFDLTVAGESPGDHRPDPRS